MEDDEQEVVAEGNYFNRLPGVVVLFKSTKICQCFKMMTDVIVLYRTTKRQIKIFRYYFTDAAKLFAEKNLTLPLTTESLRNAYAEKWSDGFFQQRAQLAYKYNRKDKGLPNKPGGSKKNKASDSVA